MTTTDTPVESQPFQAEVSELLHLMVHSVYSETDIFLRELISNASDACDKLRYEAIARPELITDGEPPKISIVPDKKDDTLVVADSGIGMDRQELIDNLGTIARSGTKAFVARLAEAKDGAGLIGQFGVGFYSAFMVAERIVVCSRRAGSGRIPSPSITTPTCRPATTTWPPTAGWKHRRARAVSVRTPSSTWASTARWNGCRARVWGSRRPARRTPCSATCRWSTRSS